MSEPEDGKVGQKAASKGGHATLTLESEKYRPWSLALNAAARRWNAFDLERKFLFAAALTVVVSMAVLGYWVEQRIRAGWIRGMAETGAVYLEGFLAPHVKTLADPHAPADAGRDAISALLVNSSLSDRVAIIKIWDLDGNLLFSTSKAGSHPKLDSDYIARIKSGEVIVDTNTGDFLNRLMNFGTRSRFIEIYAPIHDQTTKEIIAIGEFYEYSQFLDKEIFTVRYTTWLLILAVAVIIIGLLRLMVKKTGLVITTQQRLLEANLTRAEALAKRNNALRRAADRARLNAAVLNESYLASIGADIHDGPIQILSLIMLKLPGTNPPARPGGENAPAIATCGDIKPLIQQALSDLRNLSTGLVLPEIEDLTAEETISLAIDRHEQHTGTTVLRDIEPTHALVSRAIRVCAYRIVQEALNNAYKHAGGNGQRVSVRFEAELLEIVIADGGRPASSQTYPEGETRLGLRGMDSRVKALLGSLTINKLGNGGTEVRAILPVRL